MFVKLQYVINGTHKIVSIVVQLLFVLDLWSQEDSDNTILVFIWVDIDGDGEGLSFQLTSASNNLDFVC